MAENTSYPKWRRCRECGRELSTYNDSGFCWTCHYRKSYGCPEAYCPPELSLSEAPLEDYSADTE